MGEELRIDGSVVAQADLERSWLGRELADTVWLFRSPAAWTMVSMSRWVGHDDEGDPTAGRATVTTRVFSRLDRVAAHVEHAYVSGSWVQLLDAGHDHDDELYRTWVPERIRRDFDRASIHDRRLVDAASYFRSGSLPAHRTAVPDWREQALGAMALRVQELGYDVVGQGELAPGAVEGPNEVVGVLVLGRYGYHATAMVRIDNCGEIYLRLADSEEVRGAPLEPLGVVEEAGAG